MRKLIRSFERSGLEYLLISGQASILYGAASFSEDVDIWIRPTVPNARRLMKALAACRARVHKLTPPLTARWMNRGHGFHFVVPDRPQAVFLDVMARPPRVKGFVEARHRARSMTTPWGVIPVVSIPDLILLKRTRRLQDYEVISNLVRIAVDASPEPGSALLRWASRATCRAEDRVDYLERLGMKADVEKCRRTIASEVASLQAADVRYWRKRIHDLRDIRSADHLLPAGTPVTRLLR
jgi:hypothetical protein